MSFDEHYLWASFLWGTIAFGYILYGWKQRSLVPFLTGLAITAVSVFVPAAGIMSLLCAAVMVATWWLARQGR